MKLKLPRKSRKGATAVTEQAPVRLSKRDQVSKRIQRKQEKEQTAENAHQHYRKVRYIFDGWERNKKQVYVHRTDNEDDIEMLSGENTKTGHFVRVLVIKKFTPVFVAGEWETLNALVRNAGATLRIKLQYKNANVKFGAMMRYKLLRLEKSINEATTADPARPGEIIARDTIIALRDSQSMDGTKIVDMFATLVVSAEKNHQLEKAVADLVSYFKNKQGKLDDLKREQSEGLRKSSPVHGKLTSQSQFFEKYHKGHVTMDTIAARTYPMTQGSSSKTKGAYLGTRTENGAFRFENICDPNDPGAQNITVMGKTGQGKSYFMKALVLSLLDEGIRVFVFDLDGEWYDLCAAVGGKYIDQTTEEGKYFDPMVIMPKIAELDYECVKYNRSRYTLAMKNTIRTYSMLGEGLSKPEIHQVGLAIRATYDEAGMDRDPKKQETWENYSGPRPTLHRSYEKLKERANDPKNEKKHYAASVCDKIEIYFDGIYSDLFGQEEQVSFDTDVPLIVYRVGNGETSDNENEVVDEETKQSQLKISMACDLVNAQIQRLKIEGVRFSAVLVDEGQRQIQNVELRRKIFQWYTSIRKWNGMMILGANTPAVLLGSLEGKGMWENTNIRVYFFMEKSAVLALESESDVPKEIQERIAQNEDTKHYILEYKKTYDELKMVVPEYEHSLYKTRGLRAS